ncbi:unnamed protein product [Mytilus coruscus]|uniref:Uncharacterized protein n=1 Tax=Mytilus coruscus TaxID=42192 RepID=A0A6J8AM51_MYTCO|nr:unnamed protein product [Mytilus coruscus]
MIMGDLHEHTQMTKTLACTYKQELMKHFKEYEEISRKYYDYLVSQRCDESSRERASHSMIASSIQYKVSIAIDNLEAMLQTFDMEELNKVKTEQLSEIIQPPDAFREPSNIGLDRKSRCSRGSSHLSRQRAKVEAAKTRAKFAQEEVELMRKQTAIQADMKLLSVKRDIEEAECELRVLNENFDDCAISEPNKQDIQRRTAEFILKQTDQNDNTPLTQNLNVDAPTFIPAVDCREVKVQNTTNATNNRYGNTRNQLSCAHTETSLLKPLADKVKSSDSVCPVHGTSRLLNEFCQNREHPSALHTDIESIKKNKPPESHEGENESREVNTACTQICGQVTGTNIATRGINPADLSNGIWMKGPAFLYNVSLGNLDNGPHQLVDADSVKEIRPDVQVAKTQTVDRNNEHKLGTHRFSTYSEWRTLVRVISLLKQLVRNLAHHSDKPEHLDAYKQPDALKQAQQFIIREVQMENYRDEIDSIRQGTSLHNNSSLSQLSPILDVDDTLRVGGRLRNYKDFTLLSGRTVKRFNTAMSNMDPLEQKNDQMSKDGLELDKETRVRTLTEKAQIEYDKTVTNYFSKLSIFKRNVDYEIGTYKSEYQTKESISVCQKRIENSLDKYLNMAEEISQYLKRKNTADSLQELENHESVYTNVELSADEVFRDMQRIQQRTKTKSVKSVRSNGRSSVASSTTKMKARAEAAKASLEFAAKEAELKKADAEIQRKQMDIQADLEFLSKQKKQL